MNAQTRRDRLDALLCRAGANELKAFVDFLKTKTDGHSLQASHVSEATESKWDRPFVRERVWPVVQAYRHMHSDLVHDIEKYLRTHFIGYDMADAPHDHAVDAARYEFNMIRLSNTTTEEPDMKSYRINVRSFVSINGSDIKDLSKCSPDELIDFVNQAQGSLLELSELPESKYIDARMAETKEFVKTVIAELDSRA